MELCLSSDVDQPDAPPDCASHHRAWAFSGSVVEDFAADEGPFVIGHCARGARTVKVLDGEGATWWFGLTALDADGADITPATPLAVGAPVEGELSVGWGGVPEQSAGWLRGAEGVALAGDTLAWWGGLETAPGALDVALGDEAGRRTTIDDCRVQPRELVFDGDDTVALQTGETGAVTVGGVAMQARVLAAWTSVSDDISPCGWAADRASWVGGR